MMFLGSVATICTCPYTFHVMIRGMVKKNLTKFAFVDAREALQASLKVSLGRLYITKPKNLDCPLRHYNYKPYFSHPVTIRIISNKYYHNYNNI